MFRRWKKQDVSPDILVAEPVDSDAIVDPAPAERATFDHLPYIDNEALEQFLADPDSVELLPVDPSDYRLELQRLIVSAFLHDASIRAKEIEIA